MKRPFPEQTQEHKSFFYRNILQHLELSGHPHDPWELRLVHTEPQNTWKYNTGRKTGATYQEVGNDFAPVPPGIRKTRRPADDVRPNETFVILSPQHICRYV